MDCKFHVCILYNNRDLHTLQSLEGGNNNKDLEESVIVVKVETIMFTDISTTPSIVEMQNFGSYCRGYIS